ncbi:MAG: hypothetical protein KJ789_09080, partial [Alphaproteobacteria bacterium]|nr:hypothetical protein [Alphaproteobacteria bacterium]
SRVVAESDGLLIVLSVIGGIGQREETAARGRARGDVTVPRSVLFVSNAGPATTLLAQRFTTAVAQSKAAAAPEN